MGSLLITFEVFVLHIVPAPLCTSIGSIVFKCEGKDTNFMTRTSPFASFRIPPNCLYLQKVCDYIQRYEILSENKKGFARKMQNPTIENIIGFLLPCPLAVVGLTTTLLFMPFHEHNSGSCQESAQCGSLRGRSPMLRLLPPNTS